MRLQIRRSRAAALPLPTPNRCGRVQSAPGHSSVTPACSVAILRPRNAYQSTPCSVMKRAKGETPDARSRFRPSVVEPPRRSSKAAPRSPPAAYAMRWRLGARRRRCRWSSTARSSSSRRPSRTRNTAARLRVGITMRPPHFDVHQSGTINNLGSQGVMFDNLIRHDPRDGGQTIIPDLAHSWEISQGRARPTRSTCARACSSTTAPSLPRMTSRPRSTASASRRKGSAFRAACCSEPSRRSRRPTSAPCSSCCPRPRPPDFIMSAIASGWNVIVRKKTLEDNNYNLRKVEIYPGTGPFKSVKRVENESWLLREEPELLEQGAAVSRRGAVLPCAAVLDRARARRCCPAASIMSASPIR